MKKILSLMLVTIGTLVGIEAPDLSVEMSSLKTAIPKGGPSKPAQETKLFTYKKIAETLDNLDKEDKKINSLRDMIGKKSDFSDEVYEEAAQNAATAFIEFKNAFNKKYKLFLIGAAGALFSEKVTGDSNSLFGYDFESKIKFDPSISPSEKMGLKFLLKSDIIPLKNPLDQQEVAGHKMMVLLEWQRHLAKTIGDPKILQERLAGRKIQLQLMGTKFMGVETK